MIEDVIKENNFDEVLEIGSGNGNNLPYLGQIFQKLIFMDMVTSRSSKFTKCKK